MPMTNARATYADTNMPGTGQLPMGHQMLVYSLQVIPDEFAWPETSNVMYPLRITPERTWDAAVIKWRKIFFQTFLQLRVEQTKSFVEGRLDHFPMGGGVVLYGGGGDTADNGSYLVHNGDKTWQATRRLAMPISLGSLESFYVSLDWPRGGLDHDQTGYAFVNGFGLQVRLTGPRQRPTA